MEVKVSEGVGGSRVLIVLRVSFECPHEKRYLHAFSTPPAKQTNMAAKDRQVSVY